MSIQDRAPMSEMNEGGESLELIRWRPSTVKKSSINSPNLISLNMQRAPERGVAIRIESNEEVRCFGLHEIDSVSELRKSVTRCVLNIGRNDAESRMLSLDQDPCSLGGVRSNLMGQNASLYKDCHEGCRCPLMDKFLKTKIVEKNEGKLFRNILKEKNLNVMASDIFGHCLEAEGGLSEIALKDLGPFS